MVEGKSVQIGQDGDGLGKYADVHRVKKVYKIGCAKGKGGKGKGQKQGEGEVKDGREEMESVVVGCMALKGQ